MRKLQRWGVSWPWQWGGRAVGLSQGLWLYDDHMVVLAALRGWNGTWGGVFARLVWQPRIARALGFHVDELLYGKVAREGPWMENLALHAWTTSLWGLLLLRLGKRAVAGGTAGGAGGEGNALFYDVSCSSYHGTHCPMAKHGYNRDCLAPPRAPSSS